MNALLTASHSLRSSPSGSTTACRRLPDPRVASAYLFITTFSEREYNEMPRPYFFS